MTSFKLKYFIPLVFLISCNQSRSFTPSLDNIHQGDTLTLYAQFADCGEWGGHIEKIEIVEKEKTLCAKFYKDTVSCLTDPNQNRKKLFDSFKKLTQGDKASIATYIHNFMLTYKKEQNSIPTSANVYKIILKDSTFNFIDWTKSWSEFRIMQKQTFE